MKWHVKKGSGNQGIISDEQTGRNVAVAYDEKDANILAAAPELLNALELAEATIFRLVPDPHARGSVQGTLDVIRWAKQSTKEES